MGFPSGSNTRVRLQGKKLGFYPCVRKIPRRREWQPTPVFLPGEFHGQGSLVGYSPWDRIESYMTERLTHTHIHTVITYFIKIRKPILIENCLFIFLHFLILYFRLCPSFLSALKAPWCLKYFTHFLINAQIFLVLYLWCLRLFYSDI